MRVLVAPDSFKGTLSARDAAAAIADGWLSVRPADEAILLPLSDGGEGTLDSFRFAHPLATSRTLTVRGPDRRPTEAEWLLLEDGTAVVELAQASGLPLMAQLDPLGADTFGLGQVLLGAVEAGAERIVIGLGGSASTDGGCGALTALGTRFLDGADMPLPPGGGALRDLRRIDRDGLVPPPSGGVTLLVDVRSPLTGPSGAAATFGPQKGAEPDQIAILEAGLRQLALVLSAARIDPHQPGTGAAGGTAFGLRAVWRAEISPGAATVGEMLQLETAVRQADLVIGGEGRLDASSAQGKVISALSELTAAAATPLIVIAGEVAVRPIETITRAVSLSEVAGGSAAARAEPARWLRTAAAVVAHQAEQLVSG